MFERVWFFVGPLRYNSLIEHAFELGRQTMSTILIDRRTAVLLGELAARPGPNPVDGGALRPAVRNRAAVASLVLLAILVLAAILGPYLTPFRYDEINKNDVWAPPLGAGHLLGADSLGRDLLARLLIGLRVSLAIGVVATLTGLPVLGSFLLGAGVGVCGLGEPRCDRSPRGCASRPEPRGSLRARRPSSRGRGTPGRLGRLESPTRTAPLGARRGSRRRGCAAAAEHRSIQERALS